MRVTENVLDSVGNWWHQVADGWQQLRDKTSRAITRFTAHEEESARTVTSWGLLPVDIRDSGKTLTVKLEIPGLEKSDFSLDVYKDQLLIRGEKRIERESRQGEYHLHECAYGSFQRLIPLPAVVDEQAVDAEYKRGVLTVTLNKKVEPGRRRIAIQ